MSATVVKLRALRLVLVACAGMLFGLSIGVLIWMVGTRHRHAGFTDPSVDRVDDAVAVLQEQLAHDATHDHLTGLANRASLMLELERASARAKRSGRGFGTLFIDLDRFKSVNDTLGHRTGDIVLCGVAQRITSATRETDLVARNGGDEFVVLAEDATDLSVLVALGDRIQAALSEAVPVDDDVIPVSASIGVSWHDPATAGDRDPLRDADIAMYQAKSTGPGGIQVFDDDMRSWVEHRVELEGALRKAVAADELDAHVQPIIDLRTGRVTGGELLCRWRTVDGVDISPTDFIALAEDSTLVVDIGRRMLERAGAVLAEWAHDEELAGLHISINLSGRHIEHPGVVADVAGVLERWAIPAERLTIELTETVLVRDLAEAAVTLGALRDIGVTISVDDFGVGHASLRYLRELPVGLVKLDRSIVAGFERSDSDTVIVHMLSQLAEVLGIDIVAEGVETEDQRERIGEIGCRYGQGFLFAHPMPIDDFPRWLADWGREHTHPALRRQVTG